MYKERFVAEQENGVPKYLTSPQGSSKGDYRLRHPNKETAVACSSDYKEYDYKEEGALKRRQKDSTLQVCSFGLIMDEIINLYFVFYEVEKGAVPYRLKRRMMEVRMHHSYRCIPSSQIRADGIQMQ